MSALTRRGPFVGPTDQIGARQIIMRERSTYHEQVRLRVCRRGRHDSFEGLRELEQFVMRLTRQRGSEVARSEMSDAFLNRWKLLRETDDGGRSAGLTLSQRILGVDAFGTEETSMDLAIPGFHYLVRNPERLGGKPTIKGTRFSVSFILACLAEGMSYEDIVREYSEFPRDSLPEVLRFASEVTDRSDVAA